MEYWQRLIPALYCLGPGAEFDKIPVAGDDKRLAQGVVLQAAGQQVRFKNIKLRAALGKFLDLLLAIVASPGLSCSVYRIFYQDKYIVITDPLQTVAQCRALVGRFIYSVQNHRTVPPRLIIGAD